MSVLNQVLNDLSARGAAPSLDQDELTARIEVAPALPGALRGKPNRPPVRRAVWAGVLTVVFAATGALAWQEYQARNVTLSARPVGWQQYAGAIATEPRSAAPTPVATAAPTITTDPTTPTPAGPAAATSGTATEDQRQSDVEPTPERSVAAATGTPPSPPDRLAAIAPADANPVRGGATAMPQNRSEVVARTSPQAPVKTDGRQPGVDTGDLVVAEAKSDNAAKPAGAPIVRRPAPPSADTTAEVSRAAELIARGRSSEAAELLRQILAKAPAHGDARAALAALQAEAGDRRSALTTILAGIDHDAVRFAAVAAQLQNDFGDTTGALATLDRIPRSEQTGAHMALRGGIAYRAGRYAAAIEAYERALQQPNPQAVWWIGLGLAHESAGQRDRAYAAFSRVDDAPNLPPDARAFVAQRLAATAPAPEPPQSARGDGALVRAAP